MQALRVCGMVSRLAATGAGSAAVARSQGLRQSSFTSAPCARLTSAIRRQDSLIRRDFRTSLVVEMGRRSSKIATKKNKEDKARGKLYGRIGKQIVAAVKAGGPSENSNSRLAAVLDQARLNNIPKDLIERNIKKATEKGQADYSEINYEAYGLGGAGLVIEVLTDNVNRAAAEVRMVINKCGGKIADPGSVLFNFAKKGFIVIDGGDEDEVLMAATDAGADDVQPRKGGKKGWEVIADASAFGAVQSALREAGFKVSGEDSGLRLVPLAEVDVPSDEHYEGNEEMIDRLLDLDDVDSVYCNMKFDEDDE